MSAPRLPEAIKQKIVDDYVNGVDLKTIADIYRIDRSYPSLLAKRRKIAHLRNNVKGQSK